MASPFAGRDLPRAVIHRDTDHLLEDYIRRSDGETTVIKEGSEPRPSATSCGTAPTRRSGIRCAGVHRSLQCPPQLVAHANYTLQLRNEGNYNGENTNQPGVPSIIGDYPEAFSAERHHPRSLAVRIPASQGSSLDHLQHEHGTATATTLSLLMRVDNNGAYSHTASVPLTSIQLARLDAAGYPDAPSAQTVYFGERGSQEFPTYAVFDFAAGYNIPVFRSLRPWDQDGSLQRVQQPEGGRVEHDGRCGQRRPEDALGLPTDFIRGPATARPPQPDTIRFRLTV